MAVCVSSGCLRTGALLADKTAELVLQYSSNHYADAQQAFYTWYCKYHGFKIEFILMPELSHTFGPVSARPNNVAVLRMSNLNKFLLLLQRGLWITAGGAQVMFMVFGDGAYPRITVLLVEYHSPTIRKNATDTLDLHV
jgi:hypothetical protein